MQFAGVEMGDYETQTLTWSKIDWDLLGHILDSEQLLEPSWVLLGWLHRSAS